MLLGLSSALGFLVLDTIAADILYTGSGPDDQESLLLLKVCVPLPQGEQEDGQH